MERGRAVTRSARAELRAELLARVPASYSPRLHLTVLTASGLGAAALALALVRDLGAWQLLAVPVFVALGNALEWHVHRDVLHRRMRPVQILYVRHTPQHHALYVAGDMAIHSPRELRFVLLPAHAVATLLGLLSPIAIALAWAGQRNLALLLVATAGVYVVAYEWLHLAFHLPPRSRLALAPMLRTLGRHHEEHHAPNLRNRWNFNVTFPLWDVLRGTLHRPARHRSPVPAAGRAAR
jgi:sterol desaturase/sphingolipid hydroxylase (fatty acid hydroxylase superfamily)